MIYFLAPDEARPSGGIRQAYLMVDVLVELGYEASIFHGTPGFRCTWFENSTPVVAKPFLELERGDILVVPEYDGCPQARALRATRRSSQLNQNHFRTFINSGFEDSWAGDYPGWPNAKAVLVTSRGDATVHGSRRLRGPLPCTRRGWSSTALDSSPDPKRKLIALMPRKRRTKPRRSCS